MKSIKITGKKFIIKLEALNKIIKNGFKDITILYDPKIIKKNG